MTREWPWPRSRSSRLEPRKDARTLTVTLSRAEPCPTEGGFVGDVVELSEQSGHTELEVRLTVHCLSRARHFTIPITGGARKSAGRRPARSREMLSLRASGHLWCDCEQDTYRSHDQRCSGAYELRAGRKNDDPAVSGSATGRPYFHLTSLTSARRLLLPHKSSPAPRRLIEHPNRGQCAIATHARTRRAQSSPISPHTHAHMHARTARNPRTHARTQRTHARGVGAAGCGRPATAATSRRVWRAQRPRNHGRL